MHALLNVLSADISLVVPLVNSLTFIVTLLVGEVVFGEKGASSPRTFASRPAAKEPARLREPFLCIALWSRSTVITLLTCINIRIRSHVWHGAGGDRCGRLH